MAPQDDVFRNGVTLLAFVMAFYALVARERKTPYMVHSVYTISFIVLIALSLSVVSTLIPKQSPGASNKPLPKTAITAVALPDYLQLSASLLLGVGLLYILFRLWREKNRHMSFRNDHLIRNTSIVRFVVSFADLLKSKKRYEHNPMSLPSNLITALKASSYFKSEEIDKVVKHYVAAPELSISAVFEVETLLQTDEVLTDTAMRFLETGCFIQYTTCNRHPIEFLMQLKSKWTEKPENSEWKTILHRIVVVDGFTPHFGFTDSIYKKRTLQAKGDCEAYVMSKPTYAGVHTAIAEAFNKLKAVDKATAGVRSPTLVIYEGCSALIDLESNEQYRIFVRHVLPSERLWGGMFTFFVEPSISDDNAAVLKGASDIYCNKSMLTNHTDPD